VAPRSGGDPPRRVQAQVTLDQRRRQCRPRAPAEGADAGDELGEVERLGQVIVGPEPKALHSIGDAACRGQHEDATLAAVRHQATADLIAVDDGNIAIQDDDVVGRCGGVTEGVSAIEDDVDRHASRRSPVATVTASLAWSSTSNTLIASPVSTRAGAS